MSGDATIRSGDRKRGLDQGRVTYTLAEAADLLGVSYITMRRRVADKTIKARRLGRLWLVNARDIEAMAP